MVVTYNYICDQCLSILNLWVRITLTAMCTPVHVYSIQHCVIKFVSDMRHVGVFFWYWIISKQIRILLYYYFSDFSFSFYYKNIVGPVICEGRHFTHMWKILTWPHLFSFKGEVSAHTNSLKPHTLYWSVYAKPGKWAVMHMCAKGIEFASLYRLSIVFLKCSYNVVFVVDILK